MTVRRYTRKPVEMDLPETSGLKRTGQLGELITDEARKKELMSSKRQLKENQPRSEAIGAAEQAFGMTKASKAFAEEQTRREKSIRDLEGRIKELITRTK